MRKGFYHDKMKQDYKGSKPGSIRKKNRSAILRLYHNEETLSVSYIARKIRLSRTTAMKINDQLFQEGYIVKAGKGASTDEGGKKPVIYSFNARKELILTFHVKYEKIEFRLTDLKYQSIMTDCEAFEKNAPPEEIAIKINAILERNNLKNNSQYHFLACIAAVHANIETETGVCMHSTYFPSWTPGSNILEVIQKTTGLTCPIYLDNWIRIKTYGESRMGLASGHDSVILLDAGWHGVSSGIISGKQLYSGKHCLSGEVGHISLEPESLELCACGSYGCLETLVSCEKLVHKAEKARKENTESLLNNDIISLPNIFNCADNNDETARTILKDHIKWFALALSNIIMLLDPEMVIMVGDYVSGCRYIEEGIRNRVQKLTLPRLNRETPLIFNSSKSVNTLKSAAVLAVDKYFEI